MTTRYGSFHPTAFLLAILAATSVLADERPDVLPGTERLTLDRPLWEEMVDGIDRFALREIEASVERRARHWDRNTTGRKAYNASVEPNRRRLRTYLGVVDARSRLEGRSPVRPNAGRSIAVRTFRWRVFRGVGVEGLLLVPPGRPKARVIAIPDANVVPEQHAGVVDGDRFPVARRLAESGCLVVVPTLVSRDAEFSGERDVAVTNQPHREWVYRPAFQMGRHVAGYEVQKVLAIVDRFERLAESGGDAPVLVHGVGEGGRIALYSGAVDTRIDGVGVEGYFGPREGVWREPIDRNVWRLLDEFGDAEIASLVAPRPFVTVRCRVPTFDGPKPPESGRRGGAAPGTIGPFDDPTASLDEFERLAPHYAALGAKGLAKYVSAGDEDYGARGIRALLGMFDVTVPEEATGLLDIEDELPSQRLRQRRQVAELVEDVQSLLERSDRARYDFWQNSDRGRSKSKTPEQWESMAEVFRNHVHDEMIGRLPEPTMPANPRTKMVIDEPTHTGYEVVLDVYPDVVAGGILLVPKGIEAGERRPVVVCQHGLEGTPEDTITTDETSRAWRAYKGFSTALVKRGFVVYAPQNPYKGGDRFRTLQRKSNPLGRSLFSYIVRQHERTLAWLADQPFVDADRIGFYGLSYGGKTAMRVPALLPPREGRPGYCLSIYSADFNEWVRKCVTNQARYSYVFTGEYEMFEWNMGHVANYAELAMLISPRPFMVERGHDDGVAPDEWVAWEYAKVRRHYVKLGIGDRTEIEWFDGPHTINGRGTFAFLHRHLKWPEEDSR